MRRPWTSSFKCWWLCRDVKHTPFYTLTTFCSLYYATLDVEMVKLLRSKWPNFWGQNDQTIHSIGPIHYSTHYHYSYSSYVHISSSSGCSLDVVMTKLLILLDPFTIQHITIIHIHHTFISPHLAAVLDSFITSFRTILGTSGRIYRLS